MVPKKNKLITHQEEFLGRKPSATALRPFGCACMIRIPSDVRQKLDSKAQQGIIICHLSFGKYRVCIPSLDKFTIARHCQIDERKFPARDWKNVVRLDQEDTNDSNYMSENENEDEDDMNLDDTYETEKEHVDEGSGTSNSEGVSNQKEIIDTTEFPHRYPRRARKPTRDWWTTCEAAYCVADKDDHPKTFEEAMKTFDADKWEEAVALELAQIEEHGTWTPTELPKDRKALSTKLVFKKKLDVSGHVARYKVRLIVHGYKQKFGLDYRDTYAPVVDYDVAISILSLFAARGACIHQADFVTAFLNGDIKEGIYITLPSQCDKSGAVYNLNKSLYGLKQAPRNWNTKLCNTLPTLGFIELDSAECVFRKGEGKDMVVIMVYVDDLILISC